jgi:xylulokinase
MFIGVDVGSSFLKGALLDPRRFRVVHSVRAPFPGFVDGLPPGRREVNVDLILDRVLELLDQLWPAADHCRALLFSGQMHGFVLTGANGRAVSNYISWLDARAAADFAITRSAIGEESYQALGNELRPGIALATLASMRRSGELEPSHVCSLASFIVSRLCGTQPVEEPTYAASLGALDLGTMEWHRPVLRALELEMLQWPEVATIRRPAGTWRGVPVFPAVGDQQCSLAGALLSDGELSVNVSTGSQLGTIASQLQRGRYQNRPYFDGRILRTVTHLPAGRALDSLVRLLTEMGAGEDPWTYILHAAASTPHTDLTANLCFFPGPLGDSGSLCGLTEQNLTVGHVFRAAFESMADNYHLAAEWLERKQPERLVFSGGLVQKSSLLRDRIAARFGVPWRCSPTEEDCLMGLLLLGAVACGDYATLAEATDAARQRMT